MTSNETTSALAAGTLLACCDAMRAAHTPWWQLSRAIERVGSASDLVNEIWDPADAWEEDVARALGGHYSARSVGVWAEKVEGWRVERPELHFCSISDDCYPSLLRRIFNPPPFIMSEGLVREDDARGVAVVGTRKPTDEGRRRARRLAAGLSERGVTVVSGLAEGIDAAAHEAALATGGRTIAVLGHGLLRPVYPASNRELASRIIGHGALVSQFAADTPPTKATFPMRNVVTSGIAHGTAVVEAGQTSGARLQARLAVEHGKRVWLLDSLVSQFDWARHFATRYGSCVRVVTSIDEILEDIDEAAAAAEAGGLPEVPAAEVARRRTPPSRDEEQASLFTSA